MRIDIEEWRIRSLEASDVAALTRYGSNRRIWLQLRDRFPHPYTETDAVTWIESVREQVPETHFAIATKQELIGSIGLELQEDVYRRSAELGYWLGEPYWGRGIATLAVRALSEYALREYDLVRIFAHVFESNPASARVLEKAGFSLEGRLRKHVTKAGKTLDEWVYAKVALDNG